MLRARICDILSLLYVVEKLAVKTAPKLCTSTSFPIRFVPSRRAFAELEICKKGFQGGLDD